MFPNADIVILIFAILELKEKLYIFIQEKSKSSVCKCKIICFDFKNTWFSGACSLIYVLCNMQLQNDMV